MLKVVQCWTKRKCFFSISKSDLVKWSRTIEEFLRDNHCPILRDLSNSLRSIHEDDQWKCLATSTKQIYQRNSSSLNDQFVKLENDRKKKVGDFSLFGWCEVMCLVRYLRYLQVAFSHRLITLDVHRSSRELSTLILHRTKNAKNLKEKFVFSSFDRPKRRKSFFCSSTMLTCELTFFVDYLLSSRRLSEVKNLLSKTLIIDYLEENFLSMLKRKNLVDKIALTLHSIGHIPRSSSASLLLNYLVKENFLSLNIIKYLIFVVKHSSEKRTMEDLLMLESLLRKCHVNEDNYLFISYLLMLMVAFNYSNELFQRQIIRLIDISLKTNSLSERCSVLFFNR